MDKDIIGGVEIDKREVDLGQELAELEASTAAAAPEGAEGAGAAETKPAPAFRKKTAEELAAAPRRARVQNDEDDIAAALELRALGLSYVKIEERLGWKNSHGNRAWRICQSYTLAKPETVN